MAKQPYPHTEPELTETTELPDSYRRWRESRLGRITDALEERLVLELLGSVEGLRVLDVGLAGRASNRQALVRLLGHNPAQQEPASNARCVGARTTPHGNCSIHALA